MLSRSFKYGGFNANLGWRSVTDWWLSIFPKFDPAPVSDKLNMLDCLGTSNIWKFRCGNCWDTCITAFDLHRYASNTGITLLFRYGIQCNGRYYSCVFLSASKTLTWMWILLLFWAGPLYLCNISENRTLPPRSHNISCGFLCHIYIFIAPTHLPVLTLRYMVQPFHT